MAFGIRSLLMAFECSRWSNRMNWWPLSVTRSKIICQCCQFAASSGRLVYANFSKHTMHPVFSVFDRAGRLRQQSINRKSSINRSETKKSRNKWAIRNSNSMFKKKFKFHSQTKRRNKEIVVKICKCHEYNGNNKDRSMQRTSKNFFENRRNVFQG